MQKCSLVFAMAVIILITLKTQEIEARMTLPQITNALKGVSKSCISKTGVSKEIVSKTKSGEFPPDKDLQCYFLCMFGGMKILKDGRISIEMMNKQADIMMPTDIIAKSKETAQKCSDLLTSEDNCERAWEFTKCYYETDPKIYFFP